MFPFLTEVQRKSRTPATCALGALCPPPTIICLKQMSYFPHRGTDQSSGQPPCCFTSGGSSATDKASVSVPLFLTKAQCKSWLPVTCSLGALCPPPTSICLKQMYSFPHRRSDQGSGLPPCSFHPRMWVGTPLFGFFRPADDCRGWPPAVPYPPL